MNERGASNVTKESRNVVFCSDKGYFVPLMVAMSSLVRRWRRDVALNITVLCAGFDDADERALRCVTSSAPGDVSLQIIDVERRLEGLRQVGHLTPMAYARVFAPELLEDESTLLYLDVDLVVLDDLAGHPPVGDQLVLGVPGERVGTVGKGLDYCAAELELDAAAPILNTGVMVLNAEQWRREGVAERVLDFVARYQDQIRLADQDAINAVCFGRIGFIGSEWNSQVDRSRPYSDTARVVHFVGPRKPWDAGLRSPAPQLWLREAKAAFRAAEMAWLPYLAKRHARALSNAW